MAMVKYIIAGSIGLVLIVLFVNIFGRNQWKKEGSDVLDIAVAIIVASIPIALPLIIQVTMAIGAATMAKEHNAVVTSSSALQDIAAMTVLCRCAAARLSPLISPIPSPDERPE